MDIHETWMEQALLLARRAGEGGDVPVGAVVVRDGQIIGRGENRRERDGDPTAHAEVMALREAARETGGWRLSGSTLYVTLEPCAMCTGACMAARVEKIVFGAFDGAAGCCGTVLHLPAIPRLSGGPVVLGGVLHGQCACLLKDFFSACRQPDPRVF